MSRTPPLETLSYLPAFEMAARHLSFKRAAEELHLTPSAISQQIRSLEEALGLKLFQRLTRALALTPAGEQFMVVVSETLERYRTGTRDILRQQGRRALRLTTDSFIAHEILIPGLQTFANEHPEVDLRLETSSRNADLHREDMDAAVRFGIGPWSGLTGTPLCPVTVTAVCAPGFVRGDRIVSPATFAQYPLIRLRDQPDPWEKLATMSSIELPDERLVFDSYFSMLRAAEKGLGIAVGVFPTTTSAVLEGRLVTPFPLRMRLRAKFHFLSKKHDAARLPFIALRDWALALFGALPDLPAGRGVTTVDEPALP